MVILSADQYPKATNSTASNNQYNGVDLGNSRTLRGDTHKPRSLIHRLHGTQVQLQGLSLAPLRNIVHLLLSSNISALGAL